MFLRGSPARNNAQSSFPSKELLKTIFFVPEGYTSGTIVIGLAEQKYSSTIYFTGNENKIIGEKVRVVNDSILFSVLIQEQDVKVLLKIEDASKMTGKAIYSDGVVPLTLTKNSDSGAK